MNRFYKYLSFALMVIWVSACTDPDEPDITALASTGGYVEVNTPALNYVVGDNGTYTVSVRVDQGEIKTTEVDVMAVFTTVERDASGAVVYRDANGDVADAETGSLTTVSSNEVLLGTMTPDKKGTSVATLDLTYADLIDGFTVSGTDFNDGALPANDGELIIGDSWTLTFVTKTSDGGEYTNTTTTAITVSTRYAGTYNIIAKQYWRIGVNRSDLDSFWPAQYTIKSIDAVTYELVDWIGPFDGNTLYFQIDPSTLAITYPAEWNGVAQTLNGQPITTCEANPGDLSNVPCTGSNIAIPVASGADKLIMTVGYFTAGSGPREFYFELEKAL